MISSTHRIEPGIAGEADFPEKSHPDRGVMTASERARRASLARHGSGRRRLIDPTTCERDYTTAELEFLQAIEEYKRRTRRPFPTWSEVLDVVRELGYRRESY